MPHVVPGVRQVSRVDPQPSASGKEPERRTRIAVWIVIAFPCSIRGAPLALLAGLSSAAVGK